MKGQGSITIWPYRDYPSSQVQSSRSRQAVIALQRQLRRLDYSDTNQCETSETISRLFLSKRISQFPPSPRIPTDRPPNTFEEEGSRNPPNTTNHVFHPSEAPKHLWLLHHRRHGAGRLYLCVRHCRAADAERGAQGRECAGVCPLFPRTHITLHAGSSMLSKPRYETSPCPAEPVPIHNPYSP